MSDIIIKPIQNKSEWEDFLKLHPEANFLQSWYWGEFHLRLSHEIQRIGFYREQVLLGVCLSIVEPARRGRYLTVPGGPILDWNDAYLVAAFFEEIKRIAHEQRCVFIRIRPQLIEDEFSQSLFKTYGAKTAPMHLHAELTNQLDIAKSEDELLTNMRKATRYEIRQAQKQNIVIKTTTDESSIKSFYDLQLATAKRQKFIPFSFNFLNTQFKTFSENNHALLYTAEFENKILAQAFVIFYGTEAVYHYGASTDLGRKYPGAYLIQWEAIKEAKKRGCQRYNLWGVAPMENSNHRFSGLSLFKRGFGGVDVAYLHAQDIVINKKRYFAVKMIERIRKRVRKV